LTSFQSLFLVNFQISTLNESHHFLVKLSCKSVYENLDAISARSAVCFFSANIAVEQGAIVADIVIALFIFALFNRTPVANLLKDTDSGSRSQNLLACGLRRGSCLIVERLVDVCNW